MKIIDKKARVFGKINIIDLAIVIIVLGAILFLHSTLVGREQFFYISLLVESATPFMLQNMSVGDKEISAFTGSTIGEILEIRPLPSTSVEKNVLVRLRVKAVEKLGKKFYKESVINIGRKMEFETDRVFFSGKIISISNNAEILAELRLSKSIIKVFFYNSPIFVAEKLKKGKINPFIEITDVSVFPINESTIHIFLKLKIDTVEIDGAKYFNNKQLKIGSSFDFLPEVESTGVIAEIGDESSSEKLEEEKIVKSERKTIILARSSSISPWVAEKIVPGKFEIDPLTKEKIAVVLKKTEKPAEIILTTETGEILTQLHPLNKDVDAEIEISTLDFKNKKFYKSSLVQVGSNLSFDFGDTSLNVQIIEIRG